MCAPSYRQLGFAKHLYSLLIILYASTLEQILVVYLEMNTWLRGFCQRKLLMTTLVIQCCLNHLLIAFALVHFLRYQLDRIVKIPCLLCEHGKAI